MIKKFLFEIVIIHISKTHYFLMISLISIVTSTFLLTIPKRKDNNLLNLYD